MDRDLTLAGRVTVYNPENDTLEDKLWHHKESILRIPNMAIHLLRGSEREGLTLDNEVHLKPIIATAIVDALLDAEDEEGEEYEDFDTKSLGSLILCEDGQTKDGRYGIEKKHLHSFLKLMAEELKVEVGNIVDFELSTVDAYPAKIIGLHKEFISSGRLDNMCSSLTSTHALIEAANEDNEDKTISMICLHDHEEVGSTSHHGANSEYIQESISRIFKHFYKKN